MTEDEIRQAIGIDGLEVRLSSNEHHYWIAAEMVIYGQKQSRSTRCPLEPTEADLERIRDVFAAWKDAESE